MHENSLQPSLGRPDRVDELAQLCSREDERYATQLQVIMECTETMRVQQTHQLQEFLIDLLKTVKSLLSLLDEMTFPCELTGNDMLETITVQWDCMVHTGYDFIQVASLKRSHLSKKY